MENNTWKCSCGQDNDGNFCINCGATKPAVAPDTVGAPAAVAPVEAAPAAIAPVEPAASAEPAAAAPAEPAAPAESAASAAPVAAAAAVAPEGEAVQVIKCQPMPETPLEDYSSVPADPEFAEAEDVPLHDTYQPVPVEVAPAVPEQSAVPAVPAPVAPVNYQNTSSNPYNEPDRASHNPYAPATVNAQPYNGGAAAAPAGNSGTGLLILGIVSVVLAFDVTLGAIICGAIGCNMAKKLKGPDGSYPTGKAKVGALLSKIGLIIGIVTTILAIVVCILLVIGVIAGAGYAISHS